MRWLFALLLLTACAPQDTSRINPECPRDNFICSTGTIVMRTGPNCEFVCPENTDPQAECDYAAQDKRYFSKYDDMCAQIPPNCQKGETYFKDVCGCGCQS